MRTATSVATLQPGGPVEPRVEAEGQGQRSRPPPPGQRLGGRGEGHAECADLRHGGGQHGQVHPLRPVLDAVHGLHGVRLGRLSRQPVDGVGRHDGDAAAAQHLGGQTCALVVGAHDPRRRAHARAGARPGGRSEPERADRRRRRASGPTASPPRVRRRRARSRCRRGRGCRGCGSPCGRRSRRPWRRPRCTLASAARRSSSVSPTLRPKWYRPTRRPAGIGAASAPTSMRSSSWCVRPEEKPAAPTGSLRARAGPVASPGRPR